MATFNGIKWGWGELHDIEHRMELAHGRREPALVCTIPNFLDDREGS